MPINTRPTDLPDFERPPINEVILSIQFDSLRKFGNAHVGRLWNEFRAEYPKISEQAPLPPVFETFGVLQPPPGMKLEAFLSPPMSRYWFEASDEVELIQIQQDRILHNWRKRQATQEYPHYEAIRNRFEADVKRFEEFLKSNNLGEIRPNQCEVTYVNTINLPGGVDAHQHLERITPLWVGTLSQASALEIEDAVIRARYVLKVSGKPYGRVHVRFAPAVLTADRSPIIRLEITARAKPENPSISDAFRLLDDERESVVRTFAEVTTREMHDFWGRINVERSATTSD